MAVLPINEVSVRKNYNNATSFGAKKRNHSEENPMQKKSAASKMAVPVIVLMAMNPSLLNAEEPIKFMPANNIDATELLAYQPAKAEAAPVLSLDSETHNHSHLPFYSEYLKTASIKTTRKMLGNGAEYHAVLTNSLMHDKSNNVENVYVIKNGYSCKNQEEHPPVVTELIYHNTNDGKEFCAVKVIEPIIDHAKNDENCGTMIREIKLDDESAQFIIDFMAGDTKWNNKTYIKFSETSSPRIMEPIIH